MNNKIRTATANLFPNNGFLSKVKTSWLRDSQNNELLVEVETNASAGEIAIKMVENGNSSEFTIECDGGQWCSTTFQQNDDGFTLRNYGEFEAAELMMAVELFYKIWRSGYDNHEALVALLNVPDDVQVSG